MACYASTFAMQAAMAGVNIKCPRSRLRLNVDFRGALGVAEVEPLDESAWPLSNECTSQCRDRHLLNLGLTRTKAPALDRALPCEWRP